MAEDDLKFAVQKFFQDTFNTSLFIIAILSSLVAIFFGWTTPVMMLVWIAVLFRLKEVRYLYPNKCMLLFFIIISIIIGSFIPEFALATSILVFLLFIPESKWNFLKKGKE